MLILSIYIYTNTCGSTCKEAALLCDHVSTVTQNVNISAGIRKIRQDIRKQGLTIRVTFPRRNLQNEEEVSFFPQVIQPTSLIAIYSLITTINVAAWP